MTYLPEPAVVLVAVGDVVGGVGVAASEEILDDLDDVLLDPASEFLEEELSVLCLSLLSEAAMVWLESKSRTILLMWWIGPGSPHPP